MTWLALTSTPKILLATWATVCRRLSREPSVDMVALVPMQRKFCPQRWRSLRTRMDTSAPCRPR